MSTKTQDIQKILITTKTIAVVGLSDGEDRPAYGVPAYLQAAGYRIIPVNPTISGRVLGEKVYPTLHDVPEAVDLVLLFRRSEDVPPHVDEAIAIGAKAIWMQAGIGNSAAAAQARDAGLTVVMDACMRTEHSRARQDARV
ncbi:MAG: CoA-binding protein [Litorilinea sp.]